MTALAILGGIVLLVIATLLLALVVGFAMVLFDLWLEFESRGGPL